MDSVEDEGAEAPGGRGAWEIAFLSGPLAGQSFPIAPPLVTIGRDEANDIVIRDDLKVSRLHARLRWKDDHWRIENISRSSFIQVDGQREQAADLAEGAIAHLGDDSSFTLRALPIAADDSQPTAAANAADAAAEADAPATPAEPARVGQTGQRPAVTPRRPAVATAPPRPSTAELADLAALAEPPSDHTQIASPSLIGLPRLEITSNTHAERRVQLLTSSQIDIGRDPGNSIVIDDRIVSGQHLRITRRGGVFTLVHPHPARARTLNGLLYQGRKIQGDEEFIHTLANGDFVRIGDEHGALITLTYRDGLDTAAPPLPMPEPIALGAEELTIGRASDNSVTLDHPLVSAHHARLSRDGATYRIADLGSTNHVYVNGDIISEQALTIGDEIRIGPYRFVYEGRQLAQYDESSFIRIDALSLKKAGVNNVTLLDDISLAIPPRTFVALVGGSGAGKSTLLDALNGLRPAQQGTVLYNGQDYYAHLAAFSAQLGYVPQDDIVHRDLTVERALYYAAKLRLPSDFTDEQIERRIREALEDVDLSHRRELMVRSLSGGQRKRVSIALELLANPSVFFLDEPTSGLDPGLDRRMMSLLRNLADRGRTVVLVTHATNNINACDYVCFLCAGGRLAYFGPPEQAKVYFDKSDFAEIYSSLEPTEQNPDIPAEAEARFRASPEYQRYVAEPLGQAHAKAAARPQTSAAATPARAEAARSRTRRLSRLSAAWSQFTLLSLRYIELLKNDPVNLALLLLQAPIIAVLLMLMMRFEIGAGIFNANAVTQCRTQIATASGVVALPQAAHAALVDCGQALTFLRTAPAGQAYAQSHGGAQRALQDFMAPGPGADAQKALFIMAFATILFGCINSTREFVKEAAIYRRERAVNLGILPYMFSKIVVLGALSLVQSAVLILIVQVGEPLQQGIIWAPTLEAYVTLALTALAGLLLGLAISAISPNADRAISFVPLILLPQVIFSGAIIPLKDYLSQTVAFLIPARWAMAALGTTVGLHASAVGGDHLFGDDEIYHGTLYSVYTQSDALHRLLLSWAALGVMIIALTIMIGVFLKRKDHAA
jgi:ABC-type multidrug transport system ATPase subunit/pSer/pThr/pTyr-binding forkhead associated (FHA) protein